MTEEEFLKQLNAFPFEHRGGMTLRDYFAAKAMQGFFERLRATQYVPHDQVAQDAYRMADAMLKEREA